MDLIKCPICGEMYSSTYHSCPFCEEDGESVRGARKKKTRGRRIADKNKALSARGGLIVVVVLVLGLLSWYLFGDSIVRGGKAPASTTGQSDNLPAVPASNVGEATDPFFQPSDETVPTDDTPAIPGTEPENGGTEPGVTEPDGTQGTSAVEPVPVTEDENVDVSNAKLNREDFTLSGVGDSFRVKVSGTEATPHWSIDNANVAALSPDGTVTAAANGSTKLRCRVGSRELVCIVRVTNTGKTAAPAEAPTSVEPITPTEPPAPGTASQTPSGSEQQTSSGTTAQTPSTTTTHVDASSLKVKTNYGTTLQKDPDTGYPDCTVYIGGDPIALQISGTDVPVSSWTSDKESVVKVASDGKLTPISKGTAHVVAKVGDATITCIIRVRQK
ncbi:MAG: hypothetical protein E7425_02350 [Ruminococcaceae bacterium]|nr:hypothetical protein [Oscillospiraceae bacterium]